MIRIGLYYDLRNPGGTRANAEVYAAALDRIAGAEALGLPAVWVTEHHGFADGYLPAPLTFAAAVAARTRTLRIGTGIVVAPLTHPQTLAEQAAVVDLVSGGRLELGLGAGWRAEEFTAFGAEHRTRYETLEHSARTIPELWASGAATPAPVQSPVPLWIGARGPRGAAIAGRTGAGLLWLEHDLLDPYLDGRRTGGHEPATARMGGLANIFLADDPERAREIITPAARRNKSSYSTGQGTKPANLLRLEVLTPQQAAKRIAETVAGLPVSDVFCFADIGGLADELVDRHVELVSTALPNLLAAAAPGHEPKGEFTR
jgi:alkanesulfonate monooxygenase SsuD/methylene tetrahydromethanopterin reductase-like flavin-dependent oxidoreductase (luciferase family)